MVRVWRSVKENPSGERRWERVASIGTGCGGCGTKATVDENPKKVMLIIANPEGGWTSSRGWMRRGEGRWEWLQGRYALHAYPMASGSKWKWGWAVKRATPRADGTWEYESVDAGANTTLALAKKDAENSLRHVYGVKGADIDPSRLDPLEQRFYEDASGTPEQRIRVLIASADGDTSQMSPYLRELAARMGGANPPRRTLTDDYLSEMIMFGGPEPISRGEAIRQMQAEGTPQRQIDAYMMGADRRREMHDVNPLYMNPINREVSAMRVGDLIRNPSIVKENSTRAIVAAIGKSYEGGPEERWALYCHSDGYPSYLGKLVHEFAAMAALIDPNNAKFVRVEIGSPGWERSHAPNVSSDPAKFIAALAGHLWHNDYASAYMTDRDPMKETLDEEWYYEVRFEGGEAKLEVYEVPWKGKPRKLTHSDFVKRMRAN